MTRRGSDLEAGNLVRFFDLANSSEPAEENEMRHQLNDDTYLIENADGKNLIVKARNVFDYIGKNKLDGNNALVYEIMCKKLVNYGHLIQMSTYKQGITNVGTYLSVDFNESLADYGSYDMDIYGFPQVRRMTMEAVFQAEAKMFDETLSLGTAFLIENDYLITARHVIEKSQNVKIMSSSGKVIPAPQSICFHKNQDVDVAVLNYSVGTFDDIHPMKIGTGNVLDEILSLGYPSIQGDIKGILVSTTGQIAATTNLHTDGKDYDIHIITAKVKGGNSGGPIINRMGMAVGIVTSLESVDEGTPSGKEFGFATHIDRVNEIIHDGMTMKYFYKDERVGLSQRS